MASKNEKTSTVDKNKTAEASAIADVCESKPKKKSEKKVGPKKVDLNQSIEVINGFNGRLIYISPRSGETFDWASFGDVLDMDLKELKNAKGSSKNFFINNWFMFKEEDQWVIDFLGLNQFYKNSINVEEFDEIFDLSADELEDKLSVVPAGQKASIAYRARQLIADGKIDSISFIKKLESLLGIELVESAES